MTDVDDAECLCHGPGDLHPCDSCGRHTDLLGKPSFKQRLVRYQCPHCFIEMTRPIEDDLTTQHFVRVDLADGVTYGDVMRVDGQRVQVALTDPPRTAAWFELWQLRDW